RRHRAGPGGRRGSWLWIDPARLARSGDLVDARDERCVAQGQPALVRQLPDAVERVRELVREPAADLLAVPEQAAEVLHPLEVRDGDAAGGRQHVCAHWDIALAQDRVGL